MESQPLSGAEANQVYDSAAGTFFESLLALPNVIGLYEQLTKAILSQYNFDPQSTVLMDFACGIGPLSVALAPYCKDILGVDISQGMVDGYAKHIKSHGITNAHAIRAELQPNEPQISGQKFDAILCSQAYHHIEDNAAITNVLKSYLKPSGVLLVIDLIRGKLDVEVLADMKALAAQTMPQTHHPRHTMVHRNGYTEEEVKALFETAGLVDSTFKEVFEKKEDGKCLGLFLAKGMNQFWRANQCLVGYSAEQEPFYDHYFEVEVLDLMIERATG